MSSSRLILRFLRVGSLGALISCVHVREPALHEPRAIPALAAVAAPLKVHSRAGTVYLLAQWRFDTADSVLEGTGTLYGIDRQPLASGAFRILLDSIALVETQRTETLHPFGITALAAMTTVWGIVTIACVADPKACFGSCPTFYVDAVNRDRPLAEGFSASFARALEATDVDALGLVQPGGRPVTIRMANEAWETHAVRTVQLLAVPARRPDEVFATAEGRFYGVEHVEPPAECAGLGGDCRAAVSARDSLEWHSPTDSSDLAAQETVELAFSPASPEQSLGLVLGARQSFVSTFVLYQTMAYFGHEAGAWLAALERGDRIAHRAYAAVWGTLGRITVSVPDSVAGWREVGSFDEAGPIATDIQLIPLGASRRPPGETMRVRLTMARGSWRIGYAALVTLGAERAATTLEAIDILGPDARARERLQSGRGYLLTYPGDEYRLTYALPRGAGSYALYIKSRGYYYEWMRGEWLAEQNPQMVALLGLTPREALRRLAPPFKAVEQGFEQHFWASRFGR
jgi:hypothetical protein